MKDLWGHPQSTELLQNVLIPIGADFVHSELSPFTWGSGTPKLLVNSNESL
jgi:hypothetical protein